jgi:hypothetical protein
MGYSGTLPRYVRKLFVQDQRSLSNLKNNKGIPASPNTLKRTMKWLRIR